MKEATGELNITLIVVISVAILLAFFYTVIWPFIRNSTISATNCTRAICRTAVQNDGTVECYEKGNINNTFYCPSKG